MRNFGFVIHATTILSVRHDGRVAMAGDGQVSIGQTILKQSARKVRKIRNGTVLGGFAGAGADAQTLFEKFEGNLEKYSGNLMRAAVELARDWRNDRVLRRLEALMIVADKTTSLLISGSGDLIEPDDGILAIGSGGNYALAAARALAKNTEMDAASIARESMRIAGEICVYTNSNVTVEELA
jgi:ATP-dependent HslUV protease subunit HslV